MKKLFVLTALLGACSTAHAQSDFKKRITLMWSAILPVSQKLILKTLIIISHDLLKVPMAPSARQQGLLLSYNANFIKCLR